ncbi:MAG: tetratricopeptide repeat protein [Myxococcota bacterium]|nr:tetratricopeptide repeat protein [Myxococcota bacterium]
MARELPEIDRLIEEGLTLYGQGDLEGALQVWENALAIDPANSQATSYVEYVRSNFELLTKEVNGEGESGSVEPPNENVPFGITEDEFEYLIEIQPGELKPSMPTVAAPLFMEPLDEGWSIEDETHQYGAAPPVTEESGAHTLDQEMGRATGEVMLELEADEPPSSGDPADDSITEPPPPELADAGMSFDDATREYDSKTRSPATPPGTASPAEMPVSDGASTEFGPETTPGFDRASDFQTPTGFGSAATGLRRRELGFVQPSRAPAAGPAPEPPPRPLAGPPAIDLGLPDPNGARPELDLDEPTTQRPSMFDDESTASGAPIQLHHKSLTTTQDFPVANRAPAEVQASRVASTDFDQQTMERAPALRIDPVVSAPTRDFGLREDSQRGRQAVEVEVEVDEKTNTQGMTFDPIDASSAQILEEIDHGAPEDEGHEECTRRRITALFDKASAWNAAGEHDRAVTAVDLALSEDPNSTLAQKLIHRNRDMIMAVFQTFLGDLQRQPQLARPLHELASAPISPRAAFLLSRIDGQVSIDEILDICGMPRLEAFRYLCQLQLRGILR